MKFYEVEIWILEFVKQILDNAPLHRICHVNNWLFYTV